MTPVVIAPSDVSSYAPAAPAVTGEQCLQAQDWVASLLERGAHDWPAVETRAEREVIRAECAYALHLQAGGTASTTRSGATGGGVKAIKVGPIEVQKTSMDGESLAAGLVISADEWYARAVRHLQLAGVWPRMAVAGASA